MERALKPPAPTDVGINSESVGGEIMEAVRNRMNVRDRVVRCGLIPGYAKEHPALSSFVRVRMKSLSVRGFMITNSTSRFPEAAKKLGKRKVMAKLKDRQPSSTHHS